MTTRDPWHFPRPELATRYMKSFELGLNSAQGIFARRRMGKTEFLVKDLIPAAEKQGYLTAYINLWDHRENPAAAIIDEFDHALKPSGVRRIASALQTPITRLKATGKVAGVGEGTVEADLGSSANAAAQGLALKSSLRRLDKSGKKLLLVLDEAHVLASAQHADLTHALRAGLDVRKQLIKVVFAGSSEATLRSMFARSSEPFYNWAPLQPFELLGTEFVEAMVDKANEFTRFPLTLKDALQAFKELHETPEFLRRYLGTYLTTPVEGHRGALEQTKALVFNDQNFLATWGRLLPADQALLAVLARGVDDLHGAQARAELARALGLGEAVPISTPRNSLRRLMAGNIVVRMETGRYRFEDDAFGEWLKARSLDDPTPTPTLPAPPTPRAGRKRS